MNKWRRYLYFVAKNSNFGTYPLRRIDASRLFYPRNQMKVTALPPEDSLLPRPYMVFTPKSSNCDKVSLEFFGLFGQYQKKCLFAAVDHHGVSFTYDVENHEIHDIESPNEPKYSRPMSLVVGDALYVLNRAPVPGSGRCRFHSLTFDPPKMVSGKPDWAWHCLQPPPFVLQPGYENTHFGSYTVVGSSSIWISMPSIGTYSFDTANGTWIKVGDCELPFCGRADFIPEYGIWLGFSANEHQLCYSSDLGASMQCQPALNMVWDDPNPQRNTILLKSCLVHLGSGKFCVAKFFEKVENELTDVGYIPQVESFAVFTGYVLKSSGASKGLEMTPHKSLRYRLQGVGDGWVF